MDLNFTRKQEKEESYRIITLKASDKSKFRSNSIYSDTSSLLTVIPKCLLSNLIKISFLWFVVLIGLEYSPYNSSVSLKCCTIIPFALIILFSTFKRSKDAYSRLIRDKSKNEAGVQVLTEDGIQEKKACEICVGDILIIQYQEVIPADIIVLAVDGAENDCFVNMTAIVGGKNLTKKVPVKETQTLISQDGYDYCSLFQQIENAKVFQPNSSFQKFSAKIKLVGNPKAIRVGLENFIVRDSVSECKWIIGLAVYTGMETKVWSNSKKESFFKLSEVEKMLNKIITWNLAMLWLGILICFGLSFLYENQGYLGELIVNFVLLFHKIIPVSLFICLLLSRLGQMIIINFKNREIKINDPKIFENLGRVEYILSGKSGVLTEDEMTVQACIVGKRLFYERQETKLEQKFSLRLKNSDLLMKEMDSLEGNESEGHLFIELIKEIEQIYDDIDEVSPKLSLKLEPDTWYFVLCLTICNNYHYEKNKLSTEERLLLNLAEKLGYTISQYSINTASLKFRNIEHKFAILSSVGLYLEDKQNKIVVKNRDTGEVIMLVRGKIEAIIDLFDNLEDSMAVEAALETLAFQNLQKIIFGYKVFTETEYEEFCIDLKTAKLSPVNIQGRIGGVFEKYQKNLKFLGLVGIENPIKPGILEAIQDLSAVGIKTWIVTGDSEESALLTGASIGLYNSQSKVIKFSKPSSPADFLDQLQTTINQELFDQLPKNSSMGQQSSGTLGLIRSEKNMLNKVPSPLKKQITTHFRRKRKKQTKPVDSISALQDLAQEKRSLTTKKINFVISIDSNTLEYVFNSGVIRKKFVILLCAAKSAFFHSMMPDHKIKLVRLMKHNLKYKPTILAVGDGNTNTGMLGEADIGISAQSADDKNLYTCDATLTNFAFLGKLIIKFGHLGEVRMSKIINLTIYKSTMLCILLFLGQIQNGFSAFNIIDYDLIVLYDLCVTLIPLIVIGVLFEDYKNEDELVNFQVYSQGYLNALVSKLKIFRSYVEGNLHGCIIYIVLIFGLSNTSNSSGKPENSDMTGIVGFMLINVVFSVKICYENLTQPLSNLLIISSTLLIHLLIIPLTLSCYLTSYTLSHQEFINQPQIFFIIFMTPAFILILCMITDMIFSSCCKTTLRTRIESFRDNIEECFVESDEWAIDEANDEISHNALNVKFESKIKEEEYQRDVVPTSKSFLRYFLLVGLVLTWIFFILKQTIESDYFVLSDWSVVPPVIFTINNILILFEKFHIRYYYFIVFCSLIFLTIALIIESSITSSFYYPIFYYIFSIGVNTRFHVSIIKAVLCFILLLTSRIVQVLKHYTESAIQLCLPSIFIMLEISLLSLIILHTIDLNRRKDYCKIKRLKSESRMYKNILSYLLPEFIRKRVKEGERYIAEDKGTVSVIFLDMSNFDDIVSIYSPQELTGFLDDIFGKIDKICKTIGVTKIETVGKTYLACAGLKDSEKYMDPKLTSVPHARRAIELGFAVIREVQKVTLKDGNTLKFKVGINSGPVTAGVVGFHKPQFSLVGDTVNTASRMSSTLTVPNAIQISMNTYNIIGDKTGLSFQDNTVDVKGKGIMNTMIVEVQQQIIEKMSNSSMLSIGSFGNAIASGRYSNHSDSSNPRLMEDEKDTPEFFMDKKFNYVNNILSFRFNESEAEFEFRQKFGDSNYRAVFYAYMLNIIFNSILVIIEACFTTYDLKYSSLFRTLVYSADLVAGIVLLILFKKYFKTLAFGYLASLLLSIDFIALFISSFFSSYPSEFYFELFCLRIIQINYCTNLFFSKLLIPNMLNFIFYYLLISIQDTHPFSYIFSALFIIAVMFCKYNSELQLRHSSIEVEYATRESEKTEELLTNMMPHHALKDLKEENLTTDRITNVTVMYADIVGFTAWSSNRQPKEVVLKLSQLFTTFDKLCLIHNVYKVHTIGDCYVVMSFQTERNRNPAKEALNVVRFAQSLIKVIDECNGEGEYKLSMRVGIHTGEIIGGITGTNIVRYDIYGADVLIANKMESNGDPGKVVVSEFTKGLLDDYLPEQFSFDFKVEINIPVLKRSVKIFRVTENEVLSHSEN